MQVVKIEEKNNESVCPGCQKKVDPLRAPAVSVVNGRITHFCSAACREQFLRGSKDGTGSKDDTGSEPPRKPKVEAKETPSSTEKEKEVLESVSQTEDVTPLPVKQKKKRIRCSKGRSRLLRHQLIDLALATVVFLSAFIAPFFLEKLPFLIVTAGTMVVLVAYRIIREPPSGIARILESAAIPLAAGSLLTITMFGLPIEELAVAATAILFAESVGRFLALLGRRRTRIVGVIEETENIPISTAWQDNAPFAVSIHKISQLLEWFRYPMAVLVGAAVYFFGAGSPVEIILAGATTLVAINPRTMRMPTGDAHLSAAIVAAERGIKVRDGHALAQVAQSRIVLFSSQVSLLEEDVSVVDWKLAEYANENKVLQALATLESTTENRIARAIVRFMESKAVHPGAVENLRHFPGQGLTGETPWGFSVCGARDLLLDHEISVALLEEHAGTIEDSGRRALFVALDNRLVGVFGIEENPVQGAKEAVRQLVQSELEPAMMTSAEVKAAHGMGKRLGIEHVIFERGQEEFDETLAEMADRGETVVVVGRDIDLHENQRSTVAVIALGDPGDTQASVNTEHFDISFVPFILELTRRSRLSSIINFTACVSLVIVGIALAAGWFSAWIVLFVASLNFAVQAFCTWNAPYPLIDKAVNSIRRFAGRLRGRGRR